MHCLCPVPGKAKAHQIFLGPLEGKALFVPGLPRLFLLSESISVFTPAELFKSSKASQPSSNFKNK